MYNYDKCDCTRGLPCKCGIASMTYGQLNKVLGNKDTKRFLDGHLMRDVRGTIGLYDHDAVLVAAWSKDGTAMVVQPDGTIKVSDTGSVDHSTAPQWTPQELRRLEYARHLYSTGRIGA